MRRWYTSGARMQTGRTAQISRHADCQQRCLTARVAPAMIRRAPCSDGTTVHRASRASREMERLADVRVHIATALTPEQLDRILAVSPRLKVSYHPYIVQETP